MYYAYASSMISQSVGECPFRITKLGVAKWRTLRFGRVYMYFDIQPSWPIWPRTMDVVAINDCLLLKRLWALFPTMGFYPSVPVNPPPVHQKKIEAICASRIPLFPKDVPQWPSCYLRSWSLVKQLINHAMNNFLVKYLMTMYWCIFQWRYFVVAVVEWENISVINYFSSCVPNFAQGKNFVEGDYYRYTCGFYQLVNRSMCYNINFTKKISTNKASVVVADFEDNIWHAMEQKNANDARMLILQEVWDSNENNPGQNDTWLCDLCRKLLVYIIIYWNINFTNTLIIILSIK